MTALGVGIVIIVWLFLALALVVLLAPRRGDDFDAHTDLALEVCRARHPSRWGSGPVPLEDSPEWGAS